MPTADRTIKTQRAAACAQVERQTIKRTTTAPTVALAIGIITR